MHLPPQKVFVPSKFGNESEPSEEEQEKRGSSGATSSGGQLAYVHENQILGTVLEPPPLSPRSHVSGMFET